MVRLRLDVVGNCKAEESNGEEERQVEIEVKQKIGNVGDQETEDPQTNSRIVKEEREEVAEARSSQDSRNKQKHKRDRIEREVEEVGPTQLEDQVEEKVGREKEGGAG